MFCVYLTTYRGNKLPPFYIGSSSLARVSAGYRGSPMSKEYGKVWREETRSNPHLFSTRVISLNVTRQEAFDRESYFHTVLGVVASPLYVNMMVANDHVRMKGKHSEASKQKMSEAQTGRKHPAEVKAKISAAHRGKAISEYHRKRLSDYAKNRTPEHLSRIGQASRMRSVETLEKLSDYAKNRTPEHKAKLYANAKGRKHTEQARANMSAAGKGKPKSEEWKAKMRAIFAAKRAAKRAAKAALALSSATE